jgi:hypothetical protein
MQTSKNSYKQKTQKSRVKFINLAKQEREQQKEEYKRDLRAKRLEKQALFSVMYGV